MNTPLIVYLHGFLSSPQSSKAQQTREFVASNAIAGELLIPELNQGPADTLRQLQELVVNRNGNPAFIGSSLGGFYATCMAEWCQAPAVLVNPAVNPHQYWRSYLGDHRHFYSDATYIVTAEHVEQLQSMAPLALTNPDNYRVYLQRHDEVLDYRRAVALYGESHCVVRQDGDHSFTDFAEELPAAFDFLLSRIG